MSTSAKNVVVGQALAAASIPVVLASDSSPTFSPTTPLPTSTSPRASISAVSTSRNGAPKGSPGLVTAITANNQSATGAFAEGLYFCLVDQTTAPTAGETVIWCVWVPANSPAYVSFDAPNQINFATGIAWAWSTTAGTITLPGVGTVSVIVRYN